MRHKIKLMIFDLDDTLAETEALNVQLINRYFLEKWSIELDESDQETVFGHSWRFIYESMIHKYSLPITIEDVQRDIVGTKRKELQHLRLKRGSGVEKILQWPCKKAIVSGSSREEIEMVLANIKLVGYFDGVFGTEDYSRSKPAPDGLLAALEFFSLPPAEAIIFEDSASGIQAGKTAGIQTVFIQEFAHLDCTTLADFSSKDFNDFTSICQLDSFDSGNAIISIDLCRSNQRPGSHSL